MTYDPNMLAQLFDEGVCALRSIDESLTELVELLRAIKSQQDATA